jgi:hypothetical protein
MAKIFSTFVDHATAQRAVDQLLHAGFAAPDVYIDPASQLPGSADRVRDGDRQGQEGQGALESIGHAVASVVGMDTPDAQAQPYLEGRRHGGTVVVVDAIGDAEAARAEQLLRAAGGMDVHRAGRRAPAWGRGGSPSAQDEDDARNAEADRRRTVERALAADQANSERAWDPDAPAAEARDRSDRTSK